MRRLDWSALGTAVVLLGALGSCDFIDLFARLEPPSELKTARVVVGEGRLSRRQFASGAHLGVVSDIQFSRAGEELVVAGSRGASLVSIGGDVLSAVPFGSPAGHVEALRLRPDEPFCFLDRGGGWQPIRLLDDRGMERFRYGPSPAPNDVAPGDLDGDGALELVVGMNGGGGIHALDERGTLQWKKSDSNVWHVEVTDLDGDRTPEILHSSASGDLTVRGADGERRQRFSLPAYVSDFQILRQAGEVLILAADGERVFLFAADGTVRRELRAPLSRDEMTAFGTFFRLDDSGSSGFALLMEMTVWDRTVFYVFAPNDELVYQEILGDDCRAVFALPETGAERILVGCTGVVWEYELRP